MRLLRFLSGKSGGKLISTVTVLTWSHCLDGEYETRAAKRPTHFCTTCSFLTLHGLERTSKSEMRVYHSQHVHRPVLELQTLTLTLFTSSSSLDFLPLLSVRVMPGS
ncbi:hypothetical protein PoB_006618800 [Plakobranchus ocellatus]|uniref:Secreted protein n=1 Tax=Plakobranchus ocellatus TaxID=259542 RepID=A0AAV4D6J9_9GAST|nr:hypothetical protein PoB_006618800 [Plakobranchus ocellatus]